MRNHEFINFKLIIFCFALLYTHTLWAQTPGLIVKPATGAGTAVLDPNGDGYVSASTSGFSTDDKAEVTFLLPQSTRDFGTNKYTLLLYNQQQQQVRAQAIHHTKFTLTREGLPKGAYFYKIQRNNLIEHSGKLIIE